MLLNSKKVDIGMSAKDFELKNVDNEIYTLKNIKKRNGFVIAFICNHCPYVKDIITRLVDDFNVLLKQDIGVAAVMPNDYKAYPEDSFENMKKISEKYNFPFPYLFDETQKIAKAYNAVCTPDFFGYNKLLKLQYRGRFDASGMTHAKKNTRHDLLEAMLQVAKTSKGPEEQIPSVGCSIKWKI